MSFSVPSSARRPEPVIARDSWAGSDEDVHHGTYSNNVSARPQSAADNPLTSFSYKHNVTPPPGGDSPPTTPLQRLLEPEPSPNAQYVTYRDDTKPDHWREEVQDGTNASNDPDSWVPYPLRPWFWIPFVCLMVALAIGLEVALHISNKNLGWPSDGNLDKANVMHYVYTLPPVAVAAIVVAMWAWTDLAIKKMQPYVDLLHGDSPPHRSLLLDYTRTNNFIVWTEAANNKHYLVALATLMVLLSLAFQPLAAALLEVRNVFWPETDVAVKNLASIGLNQDAQFNDLTSFLTAAGYASASVLYGLANPPFIRDTYTVTPFELPLNLATNGTVFANTTALKSETGCQAVPVNMQNHTDGSGWTNSAAFNGCSISFEVDHNATSLFGTDILICDNPTPAQFTPIILWFFIYKPIPKASASFCFPTISLWDVSIEVDLASGNLTSVTELQPFTSSSDSSSLSANVTGPPLNGRAYNGIEFNLTNPDRFVIGRRNATQLQLPASVFQSAVQSPEGLVGAFNDDLFGELADKVYGTYLNLIAKTVYFLPTSNDLTVQVKTVRQRVFLSGTAVHLLAASFLVMAIAATLIHLFHRADRRNLHLKHEPGTIASAVSIGGHTNISRLLSGRQRTKDINSVLRNKKFRIDPITMKIVMEGEEGYETAQTPRRSIFGTMQANRGSTRFSKTLDTPMTPRSGGSV